MLTPSRRAPDCFPSVGKTPSLREGARFRVRRLTSRVSVEPPRPRFRVRPTATPEPVASAPPFREAPARAATSTRQRVARLGAGIGRPTKFSWAWAERYLAALRAGHFRSTAATLTGKNPRTVAWWIKAGTLGGGGDLTRFVQRVETAEAQAEATAVAVIARETAVDPALAIRFLRLRYPERFTPRRSP